jgi:hypothetical protein
MPDPAAHSPNPSTDPIYGLTSAMLTEVLEIEFHPILDTISI